ncbi:hypothetical protein TruAng_001418 [Truncatella angustata]|nr:hypothetical protein TruAng_001418 [Truncatella angustata]
MLASLGQARASNDHLRGIVPAVSSPILPEVNISGTRLSRHSLQQSDDDTNDVLNAVRDLSLSASGCYVGASSNITIGRVLSSVLRSEKSPVAGHVEHFNAPIEENDPAPKSILSTGFSDMTGEPFLAPTVAHRLLEGWFQHVATRYPVLYTANVMELHNSRETLTEAYDRSILHLVYAVSGRWLESAGETGHFSTDHHYNAAYQNMDAILQLRDYRTVDYLLLMALYCTRAPRNPGAWTYVGAAMRLCIELGLHRRQRRIQPGIELEMSKRRFWTTYFLDRDISIAIGRPPSLSDHDIDAEMPLDIDEDTSNDDIIRQASMHLANIPASPANSLTSFLHRLRLKRVESEIQHEIYRVDQPKTVSDDTINDFLDRLKSWKDAIPFEAKAFAHQSNVPYEGLELYTIHYHRCVRYLLYPSLAEVPINGHYLELCAEACSGIISDYRRLHRVFPVGFSALSIQSVFLAGYINVDGSLTDCQLLLYIVAERYPSARRYRDIFERIKVAILDIIAQGKHEPRLPVCLDPSAQESVAGFQGQWGHGMAGMGNEYNFMINNMIGAPVTTPPFELELDPTATCLLGEYAQHTADFGFPVWPTMPQLREGSMAWMQ